MLTTRLSIGTSAWAGCLLCAAAQSTNLPALAEWDSEMRLAVSGGYRDNVLRSGMVDEDSGFIMTSLDASLMRLSAAGSYLMFYLFGEDIRYFDAPSVNYEQFISGVISGAIPVSDHDELGVETSYLYQHQVYDASETQVDQRRLLVLGHSLAVRPFWEHSFSKQWGTRLEAGAFRQIYEQDLDDYSEGIGKLKLSRNYGYRSKWSVGYEYLKRIYDTREQFDESGLIIPDTDLVYDQHKLMGECWHYWDEKRQWRSLSQISGLLNRDNGSGYFDYDRLLLREQLRWDNGTWAVKGNARFGWYFYALQTVGAEKRERSYLTLDIRVERTFGVHWAVFIMGEQEWNMSNDPLDEYTTWMAHGGLGYTF